MKCLGIRQPTIEVSLNHTTSKASTDHAVEVTPVQVLFDPLAHNKDMETGQSSVRTNKTGIYSAQFTEVMSEFTVET